MAAKSHPEPTIARDPALFVATHKAGADLRLDCVPTVSTYRLAMFPEQIDLSPKGRFFDFSCASSFASSARGSAFSLVHQVLHIRRIDLDSSRQEMDNVLRLFKRLQHTSALCKKIHEKNEKMMKQLKFT